MTSSHETMTDLAAYAGSWTLDPAHTSIEFHTKAVWVANVKGTFKAIEGGGTVDADGTVTGSILLDAASVDTRKKKRDDHLRTADFFEVNSYPTITFTLTGAHPTQTGKLDVTGTLTVRETTRPITLLADVSMADGSAIVSAETDIDRSEWGITWAKMGAGLKNHVVINARFTKV
jgi:polyisoprenoid-binding protein YceI